MQRLHVSGSKIVKEDGGELRLRGINIGGWLNLENFIGGFPGTEHGIRDAVADELGANRARWFFERMEEHFFGEADVRFLAEQGFTVMRVPLNYRQFESDMLPFEYSELGFGKLDRLLDWCAKYSIYAILDMHAAQGWQNTHWHSDNDIRHTFLWDDKLYQNRFIALWKAIASRYKDRPEVAAYELMNEPCVNTAHGDYPNNFFAGYTPCWSKINDLYRRAVKEIRGADPAHIILLGGERYNVLFDGLDAPFADNLAYTSHNYTGAGFGQGEYPGEPGVAKFKETRIKYWDKEVQRGEFYRHEGTLFAEKHNVPLLVGEFGSVFATDTEESRESRLRAFRDQLEIIEEFGAHWTPWTYKDVGLMGVVTLDPSCEYLRVTADVTAKRLELFADDWLCWMPDTRTSELIGKLAKHVAGVIDDGVTRADDVAACYVQSAMSVGTAYMLAPLYAKKFAGLSDEKLDDILSAFRFENCRVNQPLLGVMKKYL